MAILVLGISEDGCLPGAGLDLSALEGDYRGGGSAPYPSSMMLALIFYGYATGIFSSRALEQATYESIPVIYLTGNTHPDHDSINTFRKRFLNQLGNLFVQILLKAYALKANQGACWIECGIEQARH